MVLYPFSQFLKSRLNNGVFFAPFPRLSCDVFSHSRSNLCIKKCRLLWDLLITPITTDINATTACLFHAFYPIPLERTLYSDVN